MSDWNEAIEAAAKMIEGWHNFDLERRQNKIIDGSIYFRDNRMAEDIRGLKRPSVSGGGEIKKDDETTTT